MRTFSCGALRGREGNLISAFPLLIFDLFAISRAAEPQVDLNGVTNGVMAETGWLTVVPAGFRPLLKWVSHRYGSPIIMITENGMDR